MKHLFLFFFFITAIISAQVKELTGKVINQSGEPLFQANVFLVNTSIGVTTNAEGNLF
jgi:hypothetical protein